jgi:Lrp/AsnC family leucine-responsive transcriptional regulator
VGDPRPGILSQAVAGYPANSACPRATFAVFFIFLASLRRIPALTDATNRKILRELQANGRMPWVELADRVNLSAPACQRRVQSLIDSGVIEGISARVNPEALGYEVEAFVSVYVDRQDVKLAQQFRKAIRKFPEVQACHMMTGQVDYLLRVVAKDLKSYGRFVEEKILGMPGVKDASSSIVLDRIKTSSSDLV